MYRDIIKNVSQKLPHQYNWWPTFFYHFTDVRNAVGILRTGCLYSREKAEQKNLMANDNASSMVIKMTSGGVDQFARLYFRPKTPTQYHNEGYKPVEVRDSNINACCPVPIFLLFDANEMLQSNDVFFSSKTLAGSSKKELLQGIENYKSLPFDKIFHNGWYDSILDGDIKQYRMAEVVIKGGLLIENYLKRIICRTIAEKNTLLYMLSKEDTKLYQKYKNIIRYNPELDMFYNNGIFVKEIVASNDELKIILNSPELRKKNLDSADIIIDIKIIFRWLDREGNLINIEEFYAQINYNKIVAISIKLIRLFSEILEVEVILDNNQMFYGIISLKDEEIFF